MNARHIEALGRIAQQELESNIQPVLLELAEGAGFTVHVSGLNFRPASDDEREARKGEIEWVLELFYVVEGHPVVAVLASKTEMAMRETGLSWCEALDTIAFSAELQDGEAPR